jgi:hypothetical protein
MDLAVLLPSLQVLAIIAALFVAWWALGDFLLDQVGIPFLDGGWGDASESDVHARSAERSERDAPPRSRPRRASAARRRNRAASSPSREAGRPYAGLSRRTGMSRVVRAW